MRTIPPWQVLSETVLLARRWLSVRKQQVQLPNGHLIDEYHLLDGPDWAGVIALTPNQDVIFVRQYRHGIGRTSLELPAGIIEPKESKLDGARREFMEETGYFAEDWQPLFSTSSEPARNSTWAHFFTARNAHLAGEAKLDPSEMLSVELHPANQIEQLIRSGEICHGLHIAALLLAERNGFFAR
ncbi:MAG TPA: NUDIX hydrolase [Polyangiaceae bacterium]|nr:NUDIX hydrolase [Polyangiaceae bacterium]